MRIDIATLFPEMCEAVLSESIIGRARRAGRVEMHCHNIRDYTLNRQKSVDDYPYGGGHGMILQAQPVYLCCKAIEAQQQVEKPHVIFLTAGGKTFTQQRAKELARLPAITLVCGHYEGVDERVIEELADEEISLGDFVITGGELAALVVADSVARMCDGVLSCKEGYEDESYYNGLLEYPQYTRPEVWRGRIVPAVLRSGHAKNIADWRAEQAVLRTKQRRPDLWEAYANAKKDPKAK
ncbi:MAG: tRNA (guanosine(37)-N1)-methyltransferase TrmD [Pygmaiobacter massiliensis]|nr:tRNA (guanosine(37)-N1)-methyltransferase TrmD [Pygmaiobacter massiliensis]